MITSEMHSVYENIHTVVVPCPLKVEEFLCHVQYPFMIDLLVLDVFSILYCNSTCITGT